jgi:dTMP kinase
VSDAAAGATPDEGVRAALAVPAFRRLWFSLSLSSLGDWLGLLATTAMAAALTTNSSADQNYAVAGVFILRLVPALLFAPVAGVVADRFNRKTTMVVSDVLRAGLFASIPIVQSLWWLLTASFLIEVLSLFWIPAKEATVPNLVPPEQLQSANQLSLFTAYGSAPVAAGLFTVLSLISGVLGARFIFFVHHPAALALWVNAASFLVCAATVAALPIPRAKGVGEHAQSPLSTLMEGWRYIGSTPMVRGLLLGLLGAFAAGGTVIGLAPTYVRGLGAGNPGYGLLFGTIFVGLAGGMLLGPKLLAGVSRRRMFGLAITAAGVLLVGVAVVPQLPVVAAITVALGGACGVAWVTGYTLIGLQVPDEMRGRTFAFVQSAVRLTLIAVLAISPLVSGLIGTQRWHPTDNTTVTYSGAAIVFAGAGLIAAVIGVEAYRHMDDRKGISLWQDLRAAVRKETFYPDPITTGYLIAFEGGDGAGKSTQVQRLADWLTGRGYEVVLTREPGATPIGRALREVLLDVGNTGLSPRAEALLYAADRAEHVDAVIRPALRRGAVVITDRYVDSSIAYQGAGRALSAAEVERLSQWATQGLLPALTVLLDIAPNVGAVRRGGARDRIEAEPDEFHERVRQGFLDLAGRAPKRYLVLDALRAPSALAAAIQARVAAELPATGQSSALQSTEGAVTR